MRETFCSDCGPLDSPGRHMPGCRKAAYAALIEAARNTAADYSLAEYDRDRRELILRADDDDPGVYPGYVARVALIVLAAMEWEEKRDLIIDLLALAEATDRDMLIADITEKKAGT